MDLQLRAQRQWRPADAVLQGRSLPWRPVELDTADIDEIQIVRSPLTGGSVQIFWQGDEVTFTEANSATAWAPDPGGQLIQTFTFRLRGLPNWKGKIRYLRFDLTEMPTHRVALYSIDAFRYQPRSQPAGAGGRHADAGRFRAIARSWPQLAPPGLPWSRDLEIAPGSRLDLRLRPPAAHGAADHLRGALQSPRTARRPPMKRYSPPRSIPQRQGRLWQDGTIDLAPAAGREGQLVFETQADASFDPLRGFPLWGNPELAAPPEGKTGKWNLVWIVIDTMRQDHLSLYGYARKTSPNLDAWAGKKAAVFDPGGGARRPGPCRRTSRCSPAWARCATGSTTTCRRPGR